MKLIKRLDTKRDNNGRIRRFGLFLCEYCGKKVEKRIDFGIRQKSCNCARKILQNQVRTKHGDSIMKNKTKLYNVWNSMKQRCYNKNEKRYKDYKI